MQLQSIMLPDDTICPEESMYFHRGEDEIRFDGYFNLFYIEKRKVYTDLTGLSLSLNLQGWKKLRVFHDRDEIFFLDLSEEISHYLIELPYEKYNSGVFWFSLSPENNCNNRNVEGFFLGKIEEMNVNEINIGISICTYKRETYLYSNLKTLETFLNQPDKYEASSHIGIWISDNGHTLKEHEEFQLLKSQFPSFAGKDALHIFENKNAGGASGFTRGMLEIMKARADYELTHILLMDDDALFNTDLFVRIYGFVSCLKKKYRKITVGGALLREDYPYIQLASGEHYRAFLVENDHPMCDLRSYENCTEEWMQTTDLPDKSYGAWWCCCYSLGVVSENNLPMPLFIHHDDIIYGLRNEKNGLVFLNGVNVWHKGFETGFPGVNKYYDVRNPLITASLFEPQLPLRTVIKRIWQSITGCLIEYRYAEALFVYKALVDFLKGPDWVANVDAEKLNASLIKYYKEKFPLKPYNELFASLNSAKYDVAKKVVEKEMGHLTLEKIEKRNGQEYRQKPPIKLITYNGWLLPGDNKLKALSALDSPFEAFRKQEIILYEPMTGKAVLAKKDYDQLKRGIGMYIRSAVLIVTKYRKVSAIYRKAYSKYTNNGFWRKYLGLGEDE